MSTERGKLRAELAGRDMRPTSEFTDADSFDPAEAAAALIARIKSQRDAAREQAEQAGNAHAQAEIECREARRMHSRTLGELNNALRERDSARVLVETSIAQLKSTIEQRDKAVGELDQAKRAATEHVAEYEELAALLNDERARCAAFDMNIEAAKADYERMLDVSSEQLKTIGRLQDAFNEAQSEADKLRHILGGRDEVIARLEEKVDTLQAELLQRPSDAEWEAVQLDLDRHVKQVDDLRVALAMAEAKAKAYDHEIVGEVELATSPGLRQVALELALQFIGNPEVGGTGDVTRAADTFFEFLTGDSVVDAEVEE